MRELSYAALGVVVALVLTLLYRRHSTHESMQPTEEVTIRVDTTTFRDVEPLWITPPSELDSLPLYHFADTMGNKWSAEVAGRDVELRSLVLRETIESRHTTNYAYPTWEVMMLGGISTSANWVGVGVERNIGKLKLSLGAGYDPFRNAPHVEGRIGVSLWRE